MLVASGFRIVDAATDPALSGLADDDALAIDNVEALDAAGVEPMVHPLPLRNVLRPDEVGAVLNRDEVLAGAPATDAGQFRVPAILGDPE